MILVIFLKIYIYFFILKKCGGIFGGFGCMCVREGLRFIKKLLFNIFVKVCLFVFYVIK